MAYPDDDRVSTTSSEPVSTHTTVIERRGSGAGLLIGLAVLVAVLVGAWFVVQASQSRSARDSAVAGAADSVSHAADKVGDAVTTTTTSK